MRTSCLRAVRRRSSASIDVEVARRRRRGDGLAGEVGQLGGHVGSARRRSPLRSSRSRVWLPTRWITVETAIELVMCWMKARNMPIATSTKRNETVTASCGHGVLGRPWSEIERSTVRE